MFFFADWCPHCTKATPEWTLFQESIEKKPVGNTAVKCVKVDCSSGEDSRIQTYGIQGYPSVILVANGEAPVKFDGRVTNDGLQKFVKEVLG